VFQWNKRDVPVALPIERLQRALNPHGWPEFEAVASEGKGVSETLRAACKAVLARLGSGTAPGVGVQGAPPARPSGVAAGAPPARPAAAGPVPPPLTHSKPLRANALGSATVVEAAPSAPFAAVAPPGSSPAPPSVAEAGPESRRRP
jgi:hypothetical protein